MVNFSSIPQTVEPESQTIPTQQKLGRRVPIGFLPAAPEYPSPYVQGHYSCTPEPVPPPLPPPRYIGEDLKPWERSQKSTMDDYGRTTYLPQRSSQADERPLIGSSPNIVPSPLGGSGDVIGHASNQTLPRAPIRSSRCIGQREITGEGLCYVYEDGTFTRAMIDGEPVNPSWGITKAGKPRKRLAQACLTCREKKIKCEPGYPKCHQCAKSQRTCRGGLDIPGAGVEAEPRYAPLSPKGFMASSPLSSFKEISRSKPHISYVGPNGEADLKNAHDELARMRAQVEEKDSRIRDLEMINIHQREKIQQEQTVREDKDAVIKQLQSSVAQLQKNQEIYLTANSGSSPSSTSNDQPKERERDSTPSSHNSPQSSEESGAEVTPMSSLQWPSPQPSADNSPRPTDIRSSLQMICFRAISKAFVNVLHHKYIQTRPGIVPGIHTSAQTTENNGPDPVAHLQGDTEDPGGSSSKRKRSGAGDTPGDGREGHSDDEENDRPRKSAKKAVGDVGQIRRRLKCPYFQRRPEEHTRAACRGEGFTDIAKLKDHLKRVHTRPLQCVRCWQSMASNAERDCHLQQDPICTRIPEPVDDRMSAQRLQELNLNGGLFGQAKTVEEKWRILFRILFPAEENVPSPYEISGMSVQFERLFTKILEEELSKELGPALSRIEGRLCGIIRRCKELADQASRASRLGGSPSSSSSRDPKEATVAPFLPTTGDPSAEVEIGDWPQWSVEDWQNIFDAPCNAYDEAITSSEEQGSSFLSNILRRPLADIGFPDLGG